MNSTIMLVSVVSLNVHTCMLWEIPKTDQMDGFR